MRSCDALARRILDEAEGRRRFVVAVAGPPGAGKSTLVETLRDAVEAVAGEVCSAVVPMDGFHYDNAILDMRGDRARKGAAFTFDVAGYAAALDRIRRADGPVAVPVFDRALDLARAGARIVEERHRIVLTEGNYLLLDEEPWAALASRFDLTILLDVPDIVLERRLVDRWLDHGLGRQDAVRRAHSNDLVNARLVMTRRRTADVILTPFGGEGAAETP